MVNDTPTKGGVLEFWNDRAKLKAAAGSNDLIAKRIEIEALKGYIRDGQNVLEIGCGNGITSLELAENFDVAITAIDFSPEMVAQAKVEACGHNLKGRVHFQEGDVRTLGNFRAEYDLIYTERVLINLPDWETQRAAIASITGKLKPGGLYVMCENSQDGLDDINAMRGQVGLKAITPPWHNRYFRDAELESARFDSVILEDVVHYSSTYYFLSRVVNAAVAASENRDPSYDSIINQLALSLPSIGKFGQGRLWLWRKVGGV